MSHLTEDQLLDYLDHRLADEARLAIDQHLEGCPICRREVRLERALVKSLRAMPAPPAARAGFYEQALHRAKEEAAVKKASATGWRHGRGFATGLAAGLALWVVTVVLSPNTGISPLALPNISLAVQQERLLDLEFDAPRAMQQARITLQLPDGVELSGYPGQRELSWETALTEGKNVLTLPVIAVGGQGGELVATLEDHGKQKILRVNMQVKSGQVSG